MDMDFRIPFERYYEELGRKTEALFHALREGILSGTLAGGARLPSSRKLAELYEVSRGSVNQAYDMLIAEGYAWAEGGSGTFVADSSGVVKDGESGTVAGARVTLSAWAEQLISSRKLFITVENHPVKAAGGAEGISFRLGQVDSSQFPVEEWKAALHAEVREMMAAFPAISSEVEGYLPLREAIAKGLRRERGIRANASQIYITNGSMHAIALLSMLLVRPELPVVVENPCFTGIRRAVAAAGGSTVAAAVDDDGIVPQDWPSKLLVVTPTRQYPTGAVLSAQRRAELLKWAGRHGAVIIEDDYDSELRWGGRPVEPLKALDHDDRVVYMGTFSKTMFVDLRLGYVVLPASLAEPFRLAKALLEPHPSALVEQRALANFITSGSYSRHLRRMKRVIGRRLLVFREQFESRLSRWFRFVPADAGLHVYAEWRGDRESYVRLQDACAAAGVHWSVGDSLWEGEMPFHTALFGFSHLTEEQIVAGAERIEAIAMSLLGEGAD
ncbi:PLP-dependent aminotransferase family protein [Paenibacillus sp. CF384]|uniref:MocR-like pyridoxine biosynthesis transcription factor PdxR n=1 Tax=Paenibacillus sp. CF384 TaxID=1884382 RepID=UPI0008977D9A|nr:PLP-dependent aminotransferase family protein [Paenibacillus sp. CF384]SDW82437.1 GntR family transcriptional regulator / MocR family aminotransferase [Paenibacillus sp. CF384]